MVSPTKIPVMLSRTGSLKIQKPILEPLRHFKSCPNSEELTQDQPPAPKSSEEHGMEDPDYNNFENDAELCSSLRSIRGSAKRKRIARMRSLENNVKSDSSLISDTSEATVIEVSKTPTQESSRTNILENGQNFEKLPEDEGECKKEKHNFPIIMSPSKVAVKKFSPSKISLSRSKELISDKAKLVTEALSDLNLQTLFSAFSKTSLASKTSNGAEADSDISNEKLDLSSSALKHNYRTPPDKLQNALTVLPEQKADWENIIEAINDVKELSANHPGILLHKTNEVTALVISHCNSLRSRIAGAAIYALKEIFAHHQGKKLLPNMQNAVAACMTEAGKENIFIREKCEQCLHQIVDCMMGTNQKLVVCLGQHLKSKNFSKRVLAARFLSVIQEAFGIEKCLGSKGLTEKILLYTATAAFDANQDVRHWGRRSVFFLQNHKSFRQLCQRHLNKCDYSRIFELCKSKVAIQSKNSSSERHSTETHLKPSISIIGKKMYSTM